MALTYYKLRLATVTSRRVHVVKCQARNDTAHVVSRRTALGAVFAVPLLGLTQSASALSDIVLTRDPQARGKRPGDALSV